MVRILGVAPYEGMKNLMDTLAEQRDDIRLDSFVGDFRAGLQVVRERDLSEYDVIVSRGGTADLIRESVSVPVFAVQLSYYDILNAIKLAESYAGRYAIVGFPSTARAAGMLCDILHYDIPIYVTHDENEVAAAVKRLREENVSLVLGDHMISRHARDLGLQSILMTSGSDSISAAFDQAVEFFRYYQTMQTSRDFYHEALRLNRRRLVVLDRGGNVLFADGPASSRNACCAIAKKMLPSVLKSGRHKAVRRSQGRSYLVIGDTTRQRGGGVALFELTELRLNADQKMAGVRMKDSAAVSDRFVRLFYGGNYRSDVQRQLTACRSAQSVILTGELGTGKDSLAEYIYATGRFSDSVLCTVDCEHLSEEAFRALADDSDSPLYHRGHVFFFRGAEKLDASRRRRLIQLYRDGALLAGNQLIFSVQESFRQLTEQEASCIRELYTNIPSVMLRVPPLRRRIHEIPSLVTLYLNELGVSGQHRVAGIEPEGMGHLQSFAWPGNLRQLCRVLEVLFQITDAPYIRADDVLDTLAGEEQLPAPGGEAVSLDLDRPLSAIIGDIIRLKLGQEGMTQTKAAQQLGICRTTLWKYLKSGV